MGAAPFGIHFSSPMLAISIVAPSGNAVASGIKTIEVRSWRPDALPLMDLVVVENKRYLSAENPEDEEGFAVALVDVHEVHGWEPSEVRAACSSGWQPGYFAWSLSNVRGLPGTQKVCARRKLYQLDGDLWR